MMSSQAESRDCCDKWACFLLFYSLRFVNLNIAPIQGNWRCCCCVEVEEYCRRTRTTLSVIMSSDTTTTTDIGTKLNTSYTRCPSSRCCCCFTSCSTGHRQTMDYYHSTLFAGCEGDRGRWSSELLSSGRIIKSKCA